MISLISQILFCLYVWLKFLICGTVLKALWKSKIKLSYR